MCTSACEGACEHAQRGLCGKDQGHQSLLFSYRMPTFLRSMQFVLVPIAASWPLEGLTASFTFGMLWEVRVPPLQANPMLSLQTHPQLVSWWVKVLDLFMFPHVDYSCGQWPDDSLARVLSLLF